MDITRTVLLHTISLDVAYFIKVYLNTNRALESLKVIVPMKIKQKQGSQK